jgi:FkbM family methyltransferase
MIELAKKWFGEQPLGFVDVGARGGVHPLVQPIAPFVSVLGFEPDKDACAALNINGLATPHLWISKALSSRTGMATLYRCAVPTNDSLRPINQAFIDRYNMVKFAQTGQDQVPTDTLDQIIYRLPQQGEFLKLDTQGTEYEILCGATVTLEHTAAVYCEVEFAQIYEGQKLFGDIEGLLRAKGFSFIGFDNMSYRSRTPWKGRERLLHADALFIKDPLEQKTMGYRQMQVAAMAAMLCGYDDFAQEIRDANGF